MPVPVGGEDRDTRTYDISRVLETFVGEMLVILTPLLFGLSFLSRMLGLRVAFVARVWVLVA